MLEARSASQILNSNAVILVGVVAETQISDPVVDVAQLPDSRF